MEAPLRSRHSEDPAVAAYARHVNPALVKLLGVLGYGRLFVRAKGTHVYDRDGRPYLDLLAGFGAMNLGHNHPRVAAVVRAHLVDEPLNLNHVGPSREAALFAEELCAAAGAPFESVLFTSSGAEAVEAALKLARAATGRKRLVSCRQGFHGLSLGALSVSGEKRLRSPFEPLLPECVTVPFGDLAALEEALAGSRAAAFLAEPIAAEGGVLVPPDGYLSRAKELCRARGTLLVLDEVQTGVGRCGSFFLSGKLGVTPDVLVTAKALGGGLVPLGAALTTRQLHREAFGSLARFDLHGATFAGNALAAAVGRETLRVVADERLAGNADVRGRELAGALRERLRGHPLVKNVRGEGLLLGVELGAPADAAAGALPDALLDLLARGVAGQWAAVRLLESGALCQPASQSWNVLKLEPPLTISREETAHAADLVVATLEECREPGRLLRDVARRAAEQLATGLAF
jgi:putrescine aminotransferase